MSYFPLDRDILSSSLWAQGTPQQVKVWVYLLLAADPRSGIVADADPAIALRCGLQLDVTVAALDWLSSPDAFSRTKDRDGRRIERLAEGGFRILNYIRHRDRDYSTPRWRKWKERQEDAKANAKANAQTVANGVGNDGQGHGHRHRHEETERIAAAPRRADRRPPAAVPSWSREACKAWTDRFEGTAPGGRIGKALKPLVELHGWPIVREAWCSYLAQAEAEYASPQRFAATFGRWSGSAQPAKPKAAAVLDNNRAVLDRFVKGGPA